MTTFVLSHNLQVVDPNVPAFDFAELAAGLRDHCASVSSAEALTHAHWKVKLESSADPESLATEITTAWRALRGAKGHDLSHVVMALGGRKDSAGCQVLLFKWVVGASMSLRPLMQRRSSRQSTGQA